MVKSPCVEVCQLNAERGMCIGCFRTLDEIARWSEMNDAQREAVVAALPARRSVAQISAAPLRR
jgi:Predicted Fe-S protein